MANREHVAIFQDESEWESWRKAEPGIRPDLSGVEVESELLSQRNFDGVEFSGAQFSTTPILECSFRGATLAGANLTKGLLLNCDFRDADLRSVQATECCFDGCNLCGATFAPRTNAAAQAITAYGPRSVAADWADLRGAKISSCTADESNFDGANLSGVSLADSTFRRGTFRHAMFRPVSGEALYSQVPI